MTPPQHPVGPEVPEEKTSPARQKELIAVIEETPAKLRAAVAGLTPGQLDTKYKNWTVRQIVHHLADSHVNAYIRFKLALTEDTPTIKPYDESRWTALEDDRTCDIAPTLTLMDGLHVRWGQLLRTMTQEQFERKFFHPESGQTNPLWRVLASYAWHCRHHTGQILWLREQHGWGKK
jgi:uncharacterized damage-inducible protein DinB